jgi:RND family efflux transporter MFP subunit
MKKKAIIIGAAALLVVVVAGVVMARAKAHKPLEVMTGKAARQKIVQTISATGKIQPKTQVDISADVSAKITQLPIVEGQWVNKGALLVSLDRDRYVAAVESATANVSSAEANAALVRENVKRNESEFKRSTELVAHGLESASDHEAKQAAYQVEVARLKSATDQVEQAKAALKQARVDLSKTTIYAPMSGTVSALNKESGEIALGSQFQKDIICTVADLSAMEAKVNVDENDIVSVAIGQQADLEVDALPDQKLHGVVTEIANSANSSGAGTTGPEDRVRDHDHDHQSAEDAAPRHDRERQHHRQDERQRAQRAAPERRRALGRPARDEGREAQGRREEVQGRQGRLRRDRVLHREGPRGCEAGADRHPERRADRDHERAVGRRPGRHGQLSRDLEGSRERRAGQHQQGPDEAGWRRRSAHRDARDVVT